MTLARCSLFALLIASCEGGPLTSVAAMQAKGKTERTALPTAAPLPLEEVEDVMSDEDNGVTHTVTPVAPDGEDDEKLPERSPTRASLTAGYWEFVEGADERHGGRLGL